MLVALVSGLHDGKGLCPAFGQLRGLLLLLLLLSLSLSLRHRHRQRVSSISVLHRGPGEPAEWAAAQRAAARDDREQAVDAPERVGHHQELHRQGPVEGAAAGQLQRAHLVPAAVRRGHGLPRAARRRRQVHGASAAAAVGGARDGRGVRADGARGGVLDVDVHDGGIPDAQAVQPAARRDVRARPARRGGRLARALRAGLAPPADRRDAHGEPPRVGALPGALHADQVPRQVPAGAAHRFART